MYAWRDFLSWAPHEASYNEVGGCGAYGIYRGRDTPCDGPYSAILLKGSLPLHTVHEKELFGGYGSSHIPTAVQMLHLLCQSICP
jgi:hypothetical protein